MPVDVAREVRALRIGFAVAATGGVMFLVLGLLGIYQDLAELRYLVSPAVLLLGLSALLYVNAKRALVKLDAWPKD